MSNTPTALNSSNFKFDEFEADLRKKTKAKGDTLVYVSQKVLYRSHAYLNQALSKRSISLSAVMALCSRYGLKLADYEIKPEPPKPVYKNPEEVVTSDVVKWADTKGWSNTLSVNMTAGIVSLAFFKDGEKIASGRAKVFGNTDHDIMQAISYAAHMCYKFSEQRELFNQNRETR